uniref:Bifunctional protein FolD n=1 Tax=Schlesneria paludicola TaxID=360056 RepID=A0A7C4QLA2_9PLAN
MSAQIIDGKAIAARLRAHLAAECTTFVSRAGVTPHLAAILVGDDPASAVYVKNKRQACEQVGFKSTVHHLPKTVTQHELLQLVGRLNAARDVHGILVQLPLPAPLHPTAVLDAVDPRKDVDCFHPENVGRLVQGRPRFLPCTPHGILVLLRETGIATVGTRVTVLGRSEIVGKPLALMLAQKGTDATVTLCHSRTPNVAEFTRMADLVIAAIGQPEYVTADMVRPGAVIIDVGINRVQSRLVGDVAFDSVSRVASYITPVPGGVGPMTIAMLLQNTLAAARLQTEGT